MDWNNLWDWLSRLGIITWVSSLWHRHRKKVAAEKELLEQVPKIKQSVDELTRLVTQLKAGEVEDLHVELDELCHVIIKQGHSTRNQYTRLNQIYEVYHALGGNGLGTKLYEEAKALPTI
ncbi:hypothetical protein [Lactobacillus sp. ESL0703]|uniref:hypothetical protein n=1 Tax=Lactobacillus sp. ESL0703 TaxID=2983218 RepID=UPI0023F77B79|nr:hypothetical protein [Lactobacillus sp. ESL0703]MDF7668511.1 hypothetical protein [Lactobacillus sp. ESL0703]